MAHNHKHSTKRIAAGAVAQRCVRVSVAMIAAAALRTAAIVASRG